MSILLCLAVLACFQPADPPQPGMRVPRPVEAASRAASSFAAPRSANLILADIDSIRMQDGGDDQSRWRAIRLHNETLKRNRIDLVSELEEADPKNARLNDLLLQKLQDINDVWDRAQFPVAAYDRLRFDIAKRHKGTDLATIAAADSMLELVHITTLGGLRIHQDDYQKLAGIELKRKDADLAGLLILEALCGDNDQALHQKWHDWMLANLGDKSMGKRFVIRKRSFGHPIKLEGETLAGPPIDTSAWKGEVILVDFWGMWCIPCREAMPELKRLHDRYAGKGLKVLGILSDHQLDKAAAWLKEKDFTWPQIVDRTITSETYDQHRIAKQYAVGGFPTLWIIDRKGVLREEGDRENLEEQLRKFLEEPR